MFQRSALLPAVGGAPHLRPVPFAAPFKPATVATSQKCKINYRGSLQSAHSTATAELAGGLTASAALLEENETEASTYCGSEGKRLLNNHVHLGWVPGDTIAFLARGVPVSPGGTIADGFNPNTLCNELCKFESPLCQRGLACCKARFYGGGRRQDPGNRRSCLCARAQDKLLILTRTILTCNTGQVLVRPAPEGIAPNGKKYFIHTFGCQVCARAHTRNATSLHGGWGARGRAHAAMHQIVSHHTMSHLSYDVSSRLGPNREPSRHGHCMGGRTTQPHVRPSTPQFNAPAHPLRPFASLPSTDNPHLQPPPLATPSLR